MKTKGKRKPGENSHVGTPRSHKTGRKAIALQHCRPVRLLFSLNPKYAYPNNGATALSLSEIKRVKGINPGKICVSSFLDGRDLY